MIKSLLNTIPRKHHEFIALGIITCAMHSEQYLATNSRYFQVLGIVFYYGNNILSYNTLWVIIACN